MGNNQTVQHRLAALHSQLTERGLIGSRIERPKWNAVVARLFGVGPQSVRQYTQHGEDLGLWQRIPNKGSDPGAVEILDGTRDADLASLAA